MSNKILYQAHRGVSTDYPENTMSAFEGAVSQGYDVIELDPNVTSDGKFVILHDPTINRTGRNKDGSDICEEIRISDITYSDAVQYDYGIWFSDKFRGEKLPLMEDVLEFAEKCGILLKIDNKIEKFEPDVMKDFISLLHRFNAKLAFTCSTVENAKRFAEEFPDAQIHYDGAVSPSSLEELTKAVPGRRCTVWLPYRNAHTTWVKVAFADKELCNTVKKYAKLGLWLLSEYEELEEAKRLGADIIETTGKIKPQR